MFGLFKKPQFVKWDYKILPIGATGEPEEPFMENEMIMEALGQIGWELVTIHENHMIFKRHALTRN